MTNNQLSQLQHSSMTLFLCYACNHSLSVKERASKLRKCAKNISAKVSDKSFKIALKAIRNNKDDLAILKAVDKAVTNYLRGK